MMTSPVSLQKQLEDIQLMLRSIQDDINKMQENLPVDYYVSFQYDNDDRIPLKEINGLYDTD